MSTNEAKLEVVPRSRKAHQCAPVDHSSNPTTGNATMRIQSGAKTELGHVSSKVDNPTSPQVLAEETKEIVSH